MNFPTNCSLPFIMMPKFNLKILIDTGSSRSFVNPEIAFRYFPSKVEPDSGMIRTAHGTSKINQRTTVPCGDIFKSPRLNLPFSIFKFHDNFDLLLGLDNLKIIKASVDLNENVLRTPNLSIQLLFNNSLDTIESFNIDARSIQQVRIKVSNIENGEAILPHTKLGEIEIPQCIVNVQNSYAFVRATNAAEYPLTATIDFPIVGEPILDCSLFSEAQDSQMPPNRHLPKTKVDFSRIRLDHLNDQEKGEIVKIVKEFSDLFQTEGQPLTFTNQIKHHIRTTDEIPIYTKPYRYPTIFKEEVKRQVNDMLEQNIIRPSNSPYNAPLWVVPKKLDASGKPKYRLVIDYRKLNEKTIPDKFPLPNISDLLDKLGRCQYFSSIDLTSSFHQIELDEPSIPKTAFSTENNHYEFLRMPYGLRNAPPTFQRLINCVLRGLQNEICLIYLDDILIYSVSLQEHCDRLRQVFRRLRSSNLKIQLDKTEFLRREISFLGHIITPEGVRPNPLKIDAITKFPLPKTRKEIKQFLGLLGYYRKFINNFAKLTKPLTSCLKKNHSIDLNNREYRECFELCKTLLTNSPILQYPDFEKEFLVTCDASDVALGAVLSQLTNGSDLPIAYASRTLNDTERRLATIEKELLAILFALKNFRPYLYGRRFTLYTDHRPLQWIFGLKDCSSKLFRWRLKLSEYDFTIKYKPGSANHVADALSRIELNNNETSSDPMPSTSFAPATPTSVDLDRIIGLLPDDGNLPDDPEEIRRILEELEGQSLVVNPTSPNSSSATTVHSNAHGNTILTIPIREGMVNHGQNQIIIRETNTTPKPVKISKPFDTKTRMTVELSTSNFEKDLVEFVKEFVQPNVKYSLYFKNDDEADSLYKKFVNTMMNTFKESTIQMTKYTEFARDVENEDEIENLISNYHIGKTNHRGITETYKKIKRTYFWPNQLKTIQNFINRCEPCLTTKYDRDPIKTKLNVTPTPSKPLETVHIDKLTLDGSKFLTIVDSFSKYAQAYYLTSNNSLEVVKNLLTYFTHHGVPKTIISDNGAEFDSSLVKELLTAHQIDIHFICSQNPNSNGVVERFHSTLVEHIRLLNNRKEFSCDSMVTKIKYALIAYNNSLHSTTELTPFEVLYGHINQDNLLKLDTEKIITNDYLAKHKEKMTAIYSELHNRSSHLKEKVANTRNRDREDIPKIPPTVYVKNKQKMSKTKDKYNKETLTEINPEMKTGKIVPRHHNTKTKIHLSNIKRPRKVDEPSKPPESSDSDSDDWPKGWPRK